MFPSFTTGLGTLFFKRYFFDVLHHTTYAESDSKSEEIIDNIIKIIISLVKLMLIPIHQIIHLLQLVHTNNTINHPSLFYSHSSSVLIKPDTSITNPKRV